MCKLPLVWRSVAVRQALLAVDLYELKVVVGVNRKVTRCPVSDLKVYNVGVRFGSVQRRGSASSSYQCAACGRVISSAIRKASSMAA